MNKIAYAFNDSSNAEKEGITVEGRKYFFSKIDDLDNIPVLHCAKVSHAFVLEISRFRYWTQESNHEIVQ
jgi:hypothetical protein